MNFSLLTDMKKEMTGHHLFFILLFEISLHNTTYQQSMYLKIYKKTPSDLPSKGIFVYIICIISNFYLSTLKYSGCSAFIDKMLPHSVQTSAITFEN